MHRVAFYDLDRTLTRRPTWSAFLVFAAAREAPWRFALLPAVAAMAGAYKFRLVKRDRLKEFMHHVMLGATVRSDRVGALATSFAQRMIDNNIRAGARAAIEADRARGYRVVLATAAHRFYAAAIAQRLGIDDVIATESSYDDAGALLHPLAGANVYGPAKLLAVEKWLRTHGVARDEAWVRFYSDHVSDAGCLAYANEPFAVNPHRPLRALARANGWPILDWRHATPAE